MYLDQAIAELAAQQKGWAQWQRLKGLDSLLRANGYQITPDRWINILDLITQMAEDSLLPDSESGVRNILAPMVCRNPIEQGQFNDLFALWWRSVDAGMQASDASVTLQALVHDQKAIPDPKWAALQTRIGKFFGIRYVLILVALIVSFGGISAMILMQSEPPVVKVQPPKPNPKLVTQPDFVEPPTANIPIEPPKPRSPGETNIESMPLALDGNAKTLLLAIEIICWSVIPILVLAALGRRRLLEGYLRRSAVPADAQRGNLKLHWTEDSLFAGSATSKAARRLHTPVPGSQRYLDIEKTVDASVRRAGLFSPEYSFKSVVPEVLVWTRYKSATDPVLALADKLVTRLQKIELTVSHYVFSGSPDYLRLHGDGQRWHRFEAVLSQHAGSRLVVIGNSEGLVNLITEQPLPWLERARSAFNVMVLVWRPKLLELY